MADFFFFFQKIILRADLGEVGNGACPSIGPVFLGLWAAAVIHGAGFYALHTTTALVYALRERRKGHTRCSIHCKAKTLYQCGLAVYTPPFQLYTLLGSSLVAARLCRVYT